VNRVQWQVGEQPTPALDIIESRRERGLVDAGLHRIPSCIIQGAYSFMGGRNSQGSIADEGIRRWTNDMAQQA